MKRVERIRVIPVLLLRGEGLVKTVRFRNPVYVGDAINSVKIFNEKEVDELVILDITASREGTEPKYERIKEIASEAFMPIAYGGGVRTIEQVKKLFQLGVEKIVFNTVLFSNPEIIRRASEQFGAQSIVVSIDVRKNWWNRHQVITRCGSEKCKGSLASIATQAVKLGAGELFINSIDRDGTYSGYDLDAIQQVAKSTQVPVIACGGAAKIQDFVDAVKIGGASAVAAGSMFVFHGVHKAVLINFPSESILTTQFYNVCHS